MKLLILLLAILAGLWLVKRNQARRVALKKRGLAVTQAMVACSHCGMHVPAQESWGDHPKKRYCSKAHWHAQGGEH